MRPRWSVRLAGLAGAFALLTAPSAGSEVADWRSYEVVAAADGMRVAMMIPGGPLSDDVFDGGAPRAQALIDRLGTSSAYAAGAYPDELVLNVPGLASGITGVPLPPYPLIAASSHPTKPSDDAGLPGVQLQAESHERASSSTARTQSETAGHLMSVASVEQSDDRLVAQAQAVVESVVIGPLSIGRVFSHARAEQAPEGELQRSSTLVVSGAQIDDQSLDLTAEGSPVLEALAEQGITIEYLEAEETPTGTIAPGLEITVIAPVSLVGEGNSAVIYSFGRAVATVDAVSGTARDGAAAVGAAAPGAGADPIAPLEADEFRVGDLEAEGPAASHLVAGPTLRTSAGPEQRVELWSMTFYVVLVATAALAIGAAAAFRQLGVRRLWGS